jgi:hypothetical protein
VPPLLVFQVSTCPLVCGDFFFITRRLWTILLSAGGEEEENEDVVRRGRRLGSIVSGVKFRKTDLLCGGLLRAR